MIEPEPRYTFGEFDTNCFTVICGQLILRDLSNKLPMIGFIVDTLYEIWANWRLALTGRLDLATIMSDRQKRIECKTLQRCRLTKDDD